MQSPLGHYYSPCIFYNSLFAISIKLDFQIHRTLFYGKIAKKNFLCQQILSDNV